MISHVWYLMFHVHYEMFNTYCYVIYIFIICIHIHNICNVFYFPIQFCGRVLMFLATVYAISERSAVNFTGKVRIHNF